MKKSLSHILRPLKNDQFWVISQGFKQKEMIAVFKAQDGPALQKMADCHKKRGADMLSIYSVPEFPGFMTWAVNILCSTNMPLVLDSSNMDDLEKALDNCQVPALINAVNVHPQQYDPILKITARYKADIIAKMQADDLPCNANHRFALLMEFVNAAHEVGILNENIWVDCVITPIMEKNFNAANLMSFIDLFPELIPKGFCLAELSNLSKDLPAKLNRFANAVFCVMLGMHNINALICDVEDEILMNLAYGRQPDIQQVIQKTVEGSPPKSETLSSELQEYVKCAELILGKREFSKT